MFLYLVRHGESIGNYQRIHQTPEMPLSEKGIRQAEIIAHKLRRKKITVILASPFKRTLQTAQAISLILKKKIEIVNEAIEFKRPSEIVGRKTTDKEVVEIRNLISAKQFLTDWHYSDEENFSEFKGRILRLMHRLEKIPARENVVLCTHGMVIRMFLLLIIFGDKLNAKTFLQFIDRISVTNATMISVSFSREKGWRIVL